MDGLFWTFCPLTIVHWAFELFNLDHFYFFSAIIEALIEEQIKKKCMRRVVQMFTTF